MAYDSNDTEQFIVQLLARLDTSSANVDYEKLKARLTKDPIIQKITFDNAMTKQSIKAMASEIHNEFAVAFKKTGIEDFELSVKDIESMLSMAVKQSNSLAKEMNRASVSADRFLAKFNKKSNGTLVNSKEYKDVQTAIQGLGNTHGIDDLNKAMSNLEITYNNMVANLRGSGKSLNPFINALNDMKSMDATIKEISLDFEKLATKPKDVANEIKKISKQQAEVNKYEVGTMEWSQAYSTLNNMISKTTKQIANLRKAQSTGSSDSILGVGDIKKEKLAYMTKVYNTIEKQMKEVNRMAKAKGWDVLDSSVKGVETAQGKIKRLTMDVKTADGSIKKLTMERTNIATEKNIYDGLVQVGDLKVVKTAISQVTDETERMAKAAEKANAQFEKLANKAIAGMNGTAKTGYENQIENLKNRYMSNGLTEYETDKNLSELTAAHNTLSNAIQKNGSEYGSLEAKNKVIAELDEKRTVALNKATNAQKKFVSEQGIILSGQERMAKADSIKKWADANTKAYRKHKNQIDEIVQTYSDLEQKVNKAQSSTMDYSFSQIKSNARITDNLGLSTFDKLKQAWQKFGGWSLATGTFTEAVQIGKQMVKNVKEIDTAMTSLYKVTDETSAKYDEFLTSAKTKSQELGRTVSGYIEQTANWAKLGFDIDKSSKLAETSSIYANVGEVDDETAVSDIVTALKAYEIAEDESMSIVDRLNVLGNKYATSSAALGEGLSKSASALALAGNDIDKSLAMITGTTEITQNALEAGNAIKVLSMRIRGMKGELEELGEDSDGIESISKIQTQILNMTGKRVNIFDEDGNFKDTYTIMKDIAKVWDDISKTDQAALLEVLAGKQRGNQISALIQSFQSGQAQSAYEDSVNSDGSAMQEQERWMTSLEAKTQQFEASFQSLSDTILDSDLLKWFVDFGSSALKTIQDISTGLGEISNIGGSLGAVSGLVMSIMGKGKYVLRPSL